MAEIHSNFNWKVIISVSVLKATLISQSKYRTHCTYIKNAKPEGYSAYLASAASVMRLAAWD